MSDTKKVDSGNFIYTLQRNFLSTQNLCIYFLFFEAAWGKTRCAPRRCRKSTLPMVCPHAIRRRFGTSFMAVDNMAKFHCKGQRTG